MRSFLLLSTAAAVDFPWNDVNRSADERVTALLAALTVPEKIGMMGTTNQAVARLNVPDFEWSNEGLHGIAWHGRSTVFPAPIGLGASFDRSILTDLGYVDAKEGRAKHYHGDGVGLSLFAPNVNIFRDPHWGRGQETYGEDPILTGELAKALISAAQEPFVETTAAPVLLTDKHYAVYNLESNFAPPLNGTDPQYRLRFYANATEQDLEFTYLVPHAHCAEAGVAAVMCAYNAVNGLPMCANGPLLDRLRDELGFQGVVVSDCGAVSFSVDPMHHFDTHVEAVAAALKAGTNLNCGSDYNAHIQEAIDQGLISADLLDERLRLPLLARVQLGDFDPTDSYREWYDKEGKDIVDSDEHRQLALKAALESLVLLRNSPVDGQPLLPLKVGSLAVISPNANSTDSLLGNYGGCRAGPGGDLDPSCNLITVLDGLSERVPVVFEQGVELDSTDDSGIAAAVATAKSAEAVVLVLGLKTCQESGPMCQEAEALDRRHLELPGLQDQLLKEVLAANPRTVLVLLNGGAVSGDFYLSTPAVLEAFYPGALGGQAVAQALFGDVSPAGRLPYTIVESEQQLPNYYSMDMSAAPGRTYRYLTEEPGFGFGFGLSYTRFNYSATVASTATGFQVEVTVTNVGQVESDDVVLAFASGSAVDGAPRVGLVGFERVHSVAPGAAAKATITVSARALAAQGFPQGAWPSSLLVGGRGPSTGKWADAATAPAAPIKVDIASFVV